MHKVVLDKIKKKAEEKKQELQDKVLDKTEEEIEDRAERLIGEELTDMRTSYDTATFGYAMAFIDNSDLYEEKQKGQKTKCLFVRLADESGGLNLEGTELVVLSACETGLGDVKAGEGVYGLQRAFQLAGAKSTIMSLWQVSDEATAKLMSYFYQNLTQGNDVNEAFQKAQTQLKKDYPNPYFWSAFMLIQTEK